ncbi:MAG: hypothetical protein IKV53_03870 [Clostridia bacterium]|nr:hypothetical protein [Clostridia bacterium]
MSMNWKKKLSSRKFWAGVVGFITPILILLNVPESEIVTISALISSCGTLVAYIISEGYVDAMHSEEDVTKNDN